MGGRAGGGAAGGMGSRSRQGGRDYLAEAGITQKDVMRVMKSVFRKNGLDAKYNAKQEAKAIQKDVDFLTVLDLVKGGRFGRPQPKK